MLENTNITLEAERIKSTTSTYFLSISMNGGDKMAEEKISFTMSTTKGDKKQSKSVTDISPTASRDQIIGLAQAINNLTTNQLSSVIRVEKSVLTDVDYLTATPHFTKELDNNNAITIDGATITISNSKLPSTTDISAMPDVALEAQYSVGGLSYFLTTDSIIWQQPEMGYIILTYTSLTNNQFLSYQVTLLQTESEYFKPMTIHATLRFKPVIINDETRYVNPLNFTINVEE